ncbi:hypothetical protein B0T20DRAFT_356395, partial [Sordaria brevicollis]
DGIRLGGATNWEIWRLSSDAPHLRPMSRRDRQEDRTCAEYVKNRVEKTWSVFGVPICRVRAENVRACH